MFRIVGTDDPQYRHKYASESLLSSLVVSSYYRIIFNVPRGELQRDMEEEFNHQTPWLPRYNLS